MHIRRALPADADSIAALHRRTIPWGLLTGMGDRFVRAVYAALIASPLGFAFVAEQDGTIVGFVAGVVNWRRFYLEFLPGHGQQVFRVMLASLRRGRWRQLWETSRYATSGELPPAELVAIGLDPAVRGGGVATELVRHLLQEFAARRVAAVRVTAGGSNAQANRLYERMGFHLHGRAAIHPGETATVYVIAVPAAAREEKV